MKFEDRSVAWFVMRAPFSRELKAKNFMDENGIVCYVPVVSSSKTGISGKRVEMTKPLLGSIVFVRSTRTELQELKEQIPFLQYYPNKVNGGKGPVIVPDDAMDRFIRLTETYSNKVLLFAPDEVNLAKGELVTIRGGVCDGLCGHFMKVKGSRNKRFVVSVSNLFTAAFLVECDYVEKVEKQ